MQSTKIKKISVFSMIPKNKNISKKNIFASIFIIFIIACIVAKPNLCINSIYGGLCVWAKCVLPSLFPFMFLTKLLTNLNFISSLTSKFYKINSKLFNAPKISSYIFLLSIISGYPVGAKMISEYHKMGIITTKQANKLCTFCSTSGPLFIIGSVGSAMFLSAKIGYILFVSHVLGSIFNGLLYRHFYNDKTNNFENFAKNEQKNTKKPQNLLAESMKDSILSVLIVGGWIAVAFLVIDIFNDLKLFAPLCNLLKIFGVNAELSNATICGIFEVSKGSILLSQIAMPKIITTTVASFLIGFGGLCVFLQASSFLKEANVNTKFYLFQKFTHGILSAGITFLLCMILGI